MKNRARSWVALGVILVVYSVVAFAPPFVKNGVFWLSYVFGVVAIAVQLYVMHTAFAKGKSVKSKFYGFPVANVGIIYMLVQLAFGILMMIFAAKLPLWIPLIVDVVMLGAAAVGFIAADAMRDEVERQDVKLKKDVSAMRALQSRAAALVNQCSSTDVTAAVRSLAEDLRYSDPISSAAIAENERQLASLMDELEQAVTDGDSAAALALCTRTSAALVERNRLCKLNPGK